MRTRPPNACPLFASAHQGKLLAALFSDAQEWKTFDRLRKDSGGSASTVHAELSRLQSACIIERDDTSRPYRFRVDMTSPLFRPLSQIVDRTVGAELLIKRALEPIAGIDAAAIFGSWARGDSGPGSDIDVIIIGNPERGSLAEAMHPVEIRIDRDVNMVIYQRSEIAARRRSSFLRAIATEPTIELIGSPARLCGNHARGALSP